MRKIKQSTTKNVMVLMVDSTDHVTGKTGLTLTITASKDGAAFASITPTVTERGNGWYNLALTAGHTDTLGDFALHITGTAADPADLVLLVEAGATDADVSSRMATYTQPTGFLAATFPTTVASTTNITAGTITTVTNLTNLPSIPSNWLTAAGIAASALNGKGDWNVGKTGYSLTATTGLGNQTANITGNLSGSVGSVTGLTAANLDVAVSTRLAAAGYTAPDNAGIASISGRLPAALVGGRMASIAEVVGDKSDYALSTSGINAVADQVWDELLTPGQHNNNNSAGRRLRLLGGASDAFSGTAAGTPTTTVVKLDATASTVDNYYVPGLMVVDDGAGGIQFSRIASYNGTTQEVTVAAPFVVAPNNGDAVSITAWASVRVSDMDANTITAAALASDAGTELADALLTRDMSAVTGEASRSPLNALRFLRNKWSAGAGVLTVRKEDDTTAAWTAAISSDAAAEPVTGIDPA